MPNHISNKLTIIADTYEAESKQFEELANLVKSDESEFDFNKVIAYPEEYAKADKARHEAEEAGVDWRKLPKDGFNAGGYEWCVENWGTKWNAYQIYKGYEELTFQTAWNTPLPVFKALSAKLPHITFRVEYADEDIGSNCEVLTFRAGEVIEEEDKRGDELFAHNLNNLIDANYYREEYWRVSKELRELKDNNK